MSSTQLRKRVRSATAARLVIVLAGLAVLEAVTRAGVINPTLIIPPSQMATAVVDGLASGELLTHFAVTLQEVAISFVIASVGGIVVGMLLWKFETWGESLAPMLLAVYAVPIFGFYPILIVWFGFGIVPIVLMATLLGSIPIIVQTRDAFRELDAVHHKISYSLQLGIVERMRRIYLPAAAPGIFSGLRLGLILCLLVAITAEFLLGQAGLGFTVRNHYQYYNSQEMYAGIVFIIIIAAGLHRLLDEFSARYFRGRQ